MSYHQLWNRLAHIYDEGEAKAIARMVYEMRYGLTLSDILLGKDTQLSADKQEELEEIAQRLSRQEPVQYVLGEAEFCGRTFHVESGVLIPRPETQWMCQHILETKGGKNKENNLSVLDIGTGSGCIAITLAAEWPKAKISAWDISEKALEIAQENALRHQVDIDFCLVDILHPQSYPPRARFDIIVSNPPYILNKERARMDKNVLDYEPATALFVPEDDPLLFHRTIGQYASQVLLPEGWLIVEINRQYGQEVCQLLKDIGLNKVSLHQDQYNNDRFVTARI